MNKKQLKITKLFRKTARHQEDYDDIQDEIQQLEQRLKEKQNELFQLQRNGCRQKLLPPKKNVETFVRPQEIIVENSIVSLKRNLELMSMLSGMEVPSYVTNDHCCVVYHMQHDANYEVKHGLRIDMKSGENEVSKSSFPLGFNLNAVMENFDSVMTPECLGAIRKALVVYYDRLEQYEALKDMLNIEAQLFKIIDGSHVEISFVAKIDMDEEEEEHINIVLMLDYRVYDIRPKTFSFREIDLPESAVTALKEQCAPFKRKPLHKAFRDAFIDGVGPYKLVQQVVPPQERQPRRKHKRFRPNQHNYNNDDTFLPEDCSEPSDDDDEVY